MGHSEAVFVPECNANPSCLVVFFTRCSAFGPDTFGVARRGDNQSMPINLGKLLVTGFMQPKASTKSGKGFGT